MQNGRGLPVRSPAHRTLADGKEPVGNIYIAGWLNDDIVMLQGGPKPVGVSVGLSLVRNLAGGWMVRNDVVKSRASAAGFTLQN